MKRIALTFIGKDRPGIIAEVSKVLFKSGCNIEDTTMTILEGEFAMITIASVPTVQIEKKLKTVLRQIGKKLGLNHFLNVVKSDRLRQKHPVGSKTYVVSVMGKDRTGIVYETSQILARAGLNITDLNSKILGAGDKAIYAMVLEVDLPKGFNLNKLDPAWRRLRQKLHVDVHTKPLEHLSF